MAKLYLIFKAHTGIYYAQIRLADGTLSNNKSIGCRNPAEVERTVMQWIVTGNIPVCVNSKDAKLQSIDKIRRSNPNSQGSSDEAIGQQFNKSARQVCKMREIAKKADWEAGTW